MGSERSAFLKVRAGVWSRILKARSGLFSLACCKEEANSDSMLELFLSLAFRCFCYYNHTQWPASENPAPLPDCSSQVPLFRTLATCKWQEGRNEHIPCLRLAILGDVCKINGFFTWLPHLPPFLIYKQPGIHTLRR